MQNNLVYCDNCQGDHGYKEVDREKTFMVRGKEVPVEYKIPVCANCEEEIYLEPYENEVLKKISDTYSKLYGMSVEEIRKIREQYDGLGLRPFAKILGIGSASVSRHEAGRDLPSEKHLEIYRELKNNPQKIFEYFERNKSALSSRELKKADEILTNWQSGQLDQEAVSYEAQEDEEIIEAIHKPLEHTEYTGFNGFNVEKLINMVLFFSRNGVAKTKLMKLLWYADFVQFKRQSLSISGAAYTRLKYGPVPKNHEIMLAHLQHMNAITIDETINDEGWTKMIIQANQPFNETMLDEDELEVIKEIDERFTNFGSRRISDYSHLEEGWLHTDEEQLIDYNYALKLRDF